MILDDYLAYYVIYTNFMGKNQHFPFYLVNHRNFDGKVMYCFFGILNPYVIPIVLIKNVSVQFIQYFFFPFERLGIFFFWNHVLEYNSVGKCWNLSKMVWGSNLLEGINKVIVSPIEVSVIEFPTR